MIFVLSAPVPPCEVFPFWTPLVGHEYGCQFVFNNPRLSGCAGQPGLDKDLFPYRCSRVKSETFELMLRGGAEPVAGIPYGPLSARRCVCSVSTMSFSLMSIHHLTVFAFIGVCIYF